MQGQLLYGVDISKPFTPIQVRDAMITCFIEAHKEDAEQRESVPTHNVVDYCKDVVRKGFKEVGGNFDDPTKESLQKVAFYLAAYSSSFRDPEIIENHKNQILSLVQRLP